MLGAESSGKSTIAEALARHYRTVWVPEFARAYWIEKKGQFVFENMLFIARHQIADEEKAAGEANQLLIADTTPLTTLIYSVDLYGRVDPELERLSRRSYDLTLLCAPDFEFVQDGLRTDDRYRQKIHKLYLEYLRLRQIPYVLLEGPHHGRLAQAIRSL